MFIFGSALYINAEVVHDGDILNAGTNISVAKDDTTKTITISTDGVATSAEVGAVKTDIQKNQTAIAANTSKITDNSTEIANNKAGINKNANEIQQNKTDIAANKNAITTNTEKINNNTADITELKNVNSALGLDKTKPGMKYFRANSTEEDAVAVGKDAVAIGVSAKANGENSVALGEDARSTPSAENSIAIGRKAVSGSFNGMTADGDSSIVVIGGGKASISIGDAANARGNSSIALGNGATVYNDGANAQLNSNSVSIGTKASTVASNNAIAMGNNAAVTKNSHSAVAVGDSAKAGAEGALALGKSAAASGVDSMAAGTEATASGTDALAMGKDAHASGADAVAIGNGAAAGSSASVVLGKAASANAVRSVVLGPNAGVGMVGDVLGAKGSHVVIGDGAGNNIDGQQNIAIGYKTGNDVKSDHNVAIGAEAGTNIGSGGNTSEGKNVSVGYHANKNDSAVSRIQSTALGSETNASDDAVAVGYQAQASGNGSTAVGFNAQAADAASVALGQGAKASDGNVAIGNDSVANASMISGTGYLTGQAAPKTVVSVGSASALRRITNVADGALDQDAVTVAQLKKSIDATVAQVNANVSSATASGVFYDTVTSGDGASITLRNAGNKGTKIHNVVAGTLGTDAANVAQVNELVDTARTHYYSVKSTNLNNYNNDLATGEDSMAAGVSAKALGDRSVALGNNTEAQSLGSITVGAGYEDPYNPGSLKQTLAVSGYQYNTAIGAGAQAAGNNSLAIGTLATSSIKNGGSSVDKAVAIGYSAGVSDDKTIAIGSDAKSNSKSASAMGDTAQALAENALAVGTNAQAEGVSSGAIGTKNRVTGVNTYVLGSQNSTVATGTAADISASNSGIFGNENRMEGDSNRIVGNNNILKMESLSNNSSNPKAFKNIFVTGNQNTVTGDPDTNTAGDAGNVSDIAITGSQNTIRAKNQRNKDLTDIQIIGNQNTLDATTQNADLSNTQVLGSHVTATLGNSVYLGSHSAYTASGATTRGMDVYNSNGTYQYAGGTPAGIVTVGSVGKERRIQNVATGLVSATSTDAVNGSQLYTMTQPLRFAGDNSTIGTTSGADVNVLHRGSDQAMSLLGGADSNNLSDKNIGVVVASANNTMTVKLAKDVTGLNGITSKTVNAETVKAGDTTVTNQGVTITGKDGKDAVSLSGKDGVGYIGLTGPKGADGKDSVSIDLSTDYRTKTLNPDKNTTVNGEEKASRIIYRDAQGDHEVVTMDDGQKYAGDNYVAAKEGAAEKNTIIKKINERLDIKGGATGALTDKNIGVNAVDGVLKVQLAQNIDLTKQGSVTMGKTVVNNDGLKITNDTANETKNVVIHGNEISYGGNQVKNMGSGASSITGEGDNKVYKYDVDTNGANIGDVKNIAGNTSTELTARGLDFAGNNTDVTVHRDLGTKLTIKGEGTKDDTSYSGENLKVIGDANGTLTIKMDKDIKGNSLTVGEKGEKGSEGQPGKDGVDGKIGVNGQDGSAVVINGKDGSIGLNGKDGANGLTIKGANGAVGVDGTDGKNGKDGMTRIVYQDANKTDHTVATLDDGQKYKGDFGDTANVALNHQVNIIGDISSYNTKNPNSKVEEKDLTDGAANVGVVTTKDDQGNATLTIKLNKNLTGLESVTAGGAKLGTHAAGDTSLTVYEIDANGNPVAKTDDNGKAVTDKAGTYVTGLTNKTWDGKTYVSGRAATEDQLMQITSSIVNQGATGGFGLSANGQNVKQDLGKTIAINGDGTYGTDGKETKAGNISTSVENEAIKVSLNKNLNIDSTTMKGNDKAGNEVSNVTNAEGSTITKTDANGTKSSTTIHAGSLTIEEGGNKTTIGGGNATFGKVTINGNGESDGSDQHTSTITGLSNKTFDTKNINQYKDSGRAATEAQLKEVYDKASQHTTVTVNGKPSADGNLKLDITPNQDGSTNYALSLNNDITLGDQDKDGKLTVKSKDSTKSITTNGEDGTLTFKDGNNTASIKAAESAKGVDGTTDINRVAIDNHTVATLDDGMKFAGDRGEALKQKLNSTTNIKGGATGDLSDSNIGVVSDGNDTLTVKLAKDIKGLNSVEATTIKATTVNSSTFNAGNTTIDNSGVTIKTGDSGRTITIKDGGVSMGGNQIHNVAPGTAPDDAVNVSQLNATNGVVNKLGSRINKVGAGAAALAALHPLDFDPDDKWDVAAGYGHYKNADAAAIGAFYQPNEDTMLSIGGSFGGGENMVNAGISVKLGQGNHVSTSRVAMAKEIKDLRENLAKLNDVVNRQSALIDKLTGVNAGTIEDKGNDLFPDVPANHWAYEYVTALHKAGILEGYPDGTFGGDRMMTRYEFAAIVYRAIMAGAASNPALNRDGTLDKLAKEFSSEMKYIRIDTISKDRNGNPDIQRVRMIPQKQEKR